jgi:hypothetical protein
MDKAVSFFILILFFINSVNGQKAPVKFGDVSMEELQMTSCYLDSTAPAVVLCDYGFFRATTLSFTRTLRIKILKKEGYVWANRTFHTDWKSTIKGVTTNLENGKVVQTKLRNESVFETRIISDYYLIRVAMPNVKVGSVIDIEYGFPGIPSEWRFQEEIPVLYSELILEESPVVRMRKNFVGYERLAYSTPTRWIARDMHAFKVEPLMNSIENYISKMKIDVLEFSGILFNTTWERVNKILKESPYFGMPATSSVYLNDLARFLSSRYNNREELLRAAYDTIRLRVNWNQKINVALSDDNISAIYKSGTGNSADINLMLFQLLKKMDFEVYPVALCTKDFGTISKYYPSIQQLNYAIVFVRIGTKEFLLDATERYMPSYMLPFRILNTDGRLVDKVKDEWVPVATKSKALDIIKYDLDISDDLIMRGNMTSTRYDYSGFDFRKKYFKFNSQSEYTEDFLKAMPGMTVREMKIENLDSIYKPLTESLVVDIANQVIRADGSLFIFPAYFEELRENPFKLETRKYPVDFGVPADKTLILNLTIPEGYSVVASPKSQVLKLTDNAAFFMYEVKTTDKSVKVTTRLGINRVLFLPDEYRALKEFYNQIIKKQSEPVVLKKRV